MWSGVPFFGFYKRKKEAKSMWKQVLGDDNNNRRKAHGERTCSHASVDYTSSANKLNC